ncbi:MAG: UDP-N-acetylmuramate dehydrogenase [bacterium]|nr:UDP-N-acetylmuramate dehydrogenase [bacterium]
MQFQENVSLKEYSNYKIGGPARYFFAPKTVDELTEAVKKARVEKLKIFILGGGTNLIINDAGFEGLVIKPEIGGLRREGNLILAGAGVLMADLLNFAIENSLSGFEWAGGLPGTVGGAVRGNAGAFGGETKDNIKEVVSLDIRDAEPNLTKRNREACQFGYRNSVFKINDGHEIVLEAEFELTPGDSAEIKKLIDEKIKYRQDRQPLEYPNIGSIFKNVDVHKASAEVVEACKAVIKTDPFPVIPTAHLINEAGLKNQQIGQAMVSPKHPNFIINLGGATAEDVKALIKVVKSTVKEKFGVDLEEEVIYV